MTLKKWLVVIISVVVLLCSAGLSIYFMDSRGLISIEEMLMPPIDARYKQGALGTAESLDGKTVCVSIYVDLKDCKWDLDGNDKARRGENLRQLKAATDWISEKAGEYGKNAEFVVDCEQYPELFYRFTWEEASYSLKLRDSFKRNELWRFIDGEIDAAALIERFDADNIIFVTYYNTDRETGGKSTAFSKDCYFDRGFSYETVFLPVYYGHDLEMVETVVAHEILHLFGAPDWYKAGNGSPEFFGITLEMCHYMRDNYPQDIMFSTWDVKSRKPLYGEIDRELSDITAYYLGLIDEPPAEFAEFGLDLSEHDPNRPH